jgi:hypothetical protein
MSDQTTATRRRSFGSSPQAIADLISQVGTATLPQPTDANAAAAAAAPGVTPQQVQQPGTDVQTTLNAPAPTVPTSSAPDLGTYLSDPSAGKNEGGFSSFINDPKTIAATIFGLAVLNSDAPSLPGAFLEGLGAVGSAQAAQRARVQQEFENRVTAQKTQQAQEQIDTQKFSAEQQAQAEKVRGALGKAGIDLQGLDLALKDRGLSLDSLKLDQAERLAKAKVKLGVRGQNVDLLRSLVAADSEAQRTGALEKSSSDALKITLFKSTFGDEAFNNAVLYGGFKGTREQFDQQQMQRLDGLTKVYPWLQPLVEEMKQTPPVAGTVGTTKPGKTESLSSGDLRRGIEYAAQQLGQATPMDNAIPGMMDWKDPNFGEMLRKASPEELQQTLNLYKQKIPGLTYADTGWYVAKPQGTSTGLVGAAQKILGGVPSAEAATTDSRTAAAIAAAAIAAGVKPGQRFPDTQNNIWQLSPDGKTAVQIPMTTGK